MRFLYVYPTTNKPYGGLKQARIQASLFAELGIETELLREHAYFRGGGLDDDVFYRTPVTTAPVPLEEAKNYVRPDDVLILPETDLEKWLNICAGWSVRVAVNNQNGFYGLHYSPVARICRERFEFAIVNASYVGGLYRHFHGLPPERIFYVPCWVHRPPFDLAPEPPDRKLAVAYMPRKVTEISAKVRRRIEQMYPSVPWVPIDGLHEPGVGKLLRANQIFFSAQDREGFGLPALEAMGCRSLVCGFTGMGKFTPPYATLTNGLWAPDRNVPAAIAVVSKAIKIAYANGSQYQDFLTAGEQTILHFSRQATLDAQRELLQVVSTKSYALRTVPNWPLSIREHAFAHKLLWESYTNFNIKQLFSAQTIQ